MSRFHPSYALRGHTRFSLALTTCLVAGSCGGPPKSAREAEHYLARGEYKAASKASTSSLRLHPKDPTSWRVRIRSDMAQGLLVQASEHYQQWKALRGAHDATAYRMMATATLWQAMGVPSPEVVSRAIRIIERHELNQLTQSVHEALSSDSDLVAGSAAVALLRSHPAAPDLATELLHSANPRVRALVCLGIGKKIGRIARGDIFPALSDSEAIVRRAAVSAIAIWKNQEDRQRLLRIVHIDPDGQVRSRALRALLFTGDADTVAQAQLSMADRYLGARLAAFSLLEKFGPAMASRLAPTLRDHSADLPLALRAAIFLAHSEGKAKAASLSLNLLTKAMASPLPASRSSALNSAAQLLFPMAAAALAKTALSDPSGVVANAAARLLLRIGQDRMARKALHSLLESHKPRAQLLAATELARLGDTAAITFLGSRAREGSPDQREAAIAAHRTAGVLSDGLVQALSDENSSVRLSAADVLLDLRK